MRCGECKAYINPYVKFVEGGRKWVCPFCNTSNAVSNLYYNAVDHTGTRVDLDQHPELIYSACEFVATADYVRRPPQPPSYVFVLDVSSSAVSSGLLLVCIFYEDFVSLTWGTDSCRCDI